MTCSWLINLSDRRIKPDIAAGAFCDKTSGVTHYGAYASILVLIDARDPLRAPVTVHENPASRIQPSISLGKSVPIRG